MSKYNRFNIFIRSPNEIAYVSLSLLAILIYAPILKLFDIVLQVRIELNVFVKYKSIVLFAVDHVMTLVSLQRAEFIFLIESNG